MAPEIFNILYYTYHTWAGPSPSAPTSATWTPAIVRYFLFLDVSGVRNEDRPYLVLLTELWLQSPLVVKGGKRLETQGCHQEEVWEYPAVRSLSVDDLNL